MRPAFPPPLPTVLFGGGAQRGTEWSGEGIVHWERRLRALLWRRVAVRSAPRLWPRKRALCSAPRTRAAHSAVVHALPRLPPRRGIAEWQPGPCPPAQDVTLVTGQQSEGATGTPQGRGRRAWGPAGQVAVPSRTRLLALPSLKPEATPGRCQTHPGSPRPLCARRAGKLISILADLKEDYEIKSVVGRKK